MRRVPPVVVAGARPAAGKDQAALADLRIRLRFSEQVVAAEPANAATLASDVRDAARWRGGGCEHRVERRFDGELQIEVAVVTTCFSEGLTTVRRCRACVLAPTPPVTSSWSPTASGPTRSMAGMSSASVSPPVVPTTVTATLPHTV